MKVKNCLNYKLNSKGEYECANCDARFRIRSFNNTTICSPCPPGCLDCPENPSICRSCDENENYILDYDKK